jgi:hypothetical protein
MSRLVNRRAVLATVGVASLGGCLGRGSEVDSTATPSNRTGGSATRPAVSESGPPTAASRLPLPKDPKSLRRQAVSGGPPKDGIPSIDDPKFVSADVGAKNLKPDDPVFGLATESEVKAYPQSILVHHEICNDEIDGRPVSVTYCPLTGTAMGFERGETTMGVSGRLVNNNLIMYDRATETWWPQILAASIPGPWNPAPPTRSLREFRLVWTTWERWRTRYPGTRMLSRETGFAQGYDSDPYGSYNPRGGYYLLNAPPMFSPFPWTEDLPPKAAVLGARNATGAVAVGKDRLRTAELVDGTLGGTSVVAVYDPVLDTGYVYLNPDGEAFDYRDGQVVDASGNGHDPDALPLESLLAFDAMWFAWKGFYPETTLYA